MFDTKLTFNQDQKREMAKTIFDLSKLSFAGLVLAQLATNNLDTIVLMFGGFMFAVFFSVATMILGTERRTL